MQYERLSICVTDKQTDYRFWRRKEKKIGEKSFESEKVLSKKLNFIAFFSRTCSVAWTGVSLVTFMALIKLSRSQMLQFSFSLLDKLPWVINRINLFFVNMNLSTRLFWLIFVVLIGESLLHRFYTLWNSNNNNNKKKSFKKQLVATIM